MTEQLFALPATEKISSTISKSQQGQLDVLVIKHDKFRAALSLQGAHLLAWQPTGEQPVIWLSTATAFTPGTAIRGGVPICWPWFGPAGKPSHGFARTSIWQLTAHNEDANGVSLTLTLKDSEETRQLWPHAFTLHAHFKLGDECSIELESQGDFETTSALHAYFEIGDIAQVAVAGLGESYIDKVLNGEAGKHSGDLTFEGQVDRVYTQPEAVSLIKDSALNRTIIVEHHHNSDVVSWNPGAELSVKMQDMADDSYKTMVCVETADVSRSAISTSAAPARLAVTIKTRPGL